MNPPILARLAILAASTGPEEASGAAKREARGITTGRGLYAKLLEVEILLGFGHGHRVPRRDAPMIVPVGRPLPVFRTADPEAVVDPLHFGGVFEGRAERDNEIREDVVPRSMTSRAPHGLDARVLESSYSPHHRVEVGDSAMDLE